MSDKNKTEKDDGPKMVTMYNLSGKPVKFADNPANHAAAERAGWTKTKPKGE